MPHVEFQVLCANDGEACSRVKSLMKNFPDIKNAPRTEAYDHYCKRYYETLEEARVRVREIYDKAGDDVISIELAVSK